jgi:hypothetical protein
VEFGYPEWDGAFSEGDAIHSRLVVLNASWGGQEHAVYAMFWAIGPAYDEFIDGARAVVEEARLPEGVGPQRRSQPVIGPAKFVESARYVSRSSAAAPSSPTGRPVRSCVGSSGNWCSLNPPNPHR